MQIKDQAGYKSAKKLKTPSLIPSNQNSHRFHNQSSQKQLSIAQKNMMQIKLLENSKKRKQNVLEMRAG